MSRKNGMGVEFEEGSGNIFADLGLEDADGLFARSQLGFYETNKGAIAICLRELENIGQNQPCPIRSVYGC